MTSGDSLILHVEDRTRKSDVRAGRTEESTVVSIRAITSPSYIVDLERHRGKYRDDLLVDIGENLDSTIGKSPLLEIAVINKGVVAMSRDPETTIIVPRIIVVRIDKLARDLDLRLSIAVGNRKHLSIRGDRRILLNQHSFVSVIIPF